MEHWAYGTDDDETPEDETTRAYAQKLQSQFLEQQSADSSSGGSTTPCAVTNAPGDHSWWQLVPDPKRAQPLPSTFQHKQPPGCAPGLEEGEIMPQGDEDEYQDPKLPPGVIDISEELRWRHREKKRLDEWARSVIVKCCTMGAGTEMGPKQSNEPPPRDAAHERTTRNHRIEAPGQPSRDRNDGRWHRDRSQGSATRPLRLPCLEHPPVGLAGPHQGSTRHRGGVGHYHHLREERKTPYQRGRSYAPAVDRRYQYRNGYNSAAWNFCRQNSAYERQRTRHTYPWE